MPELKLSEQIRNPRFLSRTERIRENLQRKREFEQQQQSEEQQTANYERLKAQAEQIQIDRFSNITSLQEYQTEYNKLTPELQQFFTSPEELMNKQTATVQESKEKVEERLSLTQQKLNENERRYQEGLQYARDREWKNPADKKEYEDNLRADYLREKQKLIGYQEGLQKGKSQLETGKPLEFGEIETYATSVGNYYEELEEARQKNKKFQGKQEQAVLEAQKSGSFLRVEESFKGTPQKEKLYAVNKDGGLTLVGEKKLSKPKEAFTSYRVGGKVDVTFRNTEAYNQKVDEYVNSLKTESPDRTVQPLTSKEKATQFFSEKFTAFKNASLVKYVSDKAINFYDKIPEGSFYIRQTQTRKFSFPISTLPIGTSPVYNALERVPLGVLPFKLPGYEEVSPKLKEFSVASKVEALQERELKEFQITEKVEPKYQAEYQSAFEQKYLGNILKGYITQEEAEKEFETSVEAQDIGERYNKEINTERAKIPFKSKAFYGVQKSGLALEEFVITSTATPKRVAVLTGGIYGGYKLIGLIPTKVLTTGTIGLATYEGYKIVSPTSTSDEVGSAIISESILATTLAYSGLKYLRRKNLVIRPENIKSPELYSSALKEVKVKSEGKVIVKDLFGKTQTAQRYSVSKISETGVLGRRTVLTTRTREFFKLGKIYEGVPTDTSGYKKALSTLKKAGYSEAGARNVLRYSAPRNFVSRLEGEALTFYERSPVTVTPLSARTTKPVKALVDSRLGIKTRGGRTIVEKISGSGFDVEKDLFAGSIKVEKGFINAKGEPYQLFKRKAYIDVAGRVRQNYQNVFEDKVFLKLSKTKLKGIITDGKYTKEIYNEYSATQQVSPFSKRAIGEKQIVNLFRGGELDASLDSQEAYGIKAIRVSPPVAKLNIEKLVQDKKYLKNLLKDLTKVYGKSTSPSSEQTLVNKVEQTANLDQQVRVSQGASKLIPPETIKTSIRLKNIDKITQASESGLDKVVAVAVSNRLTQKTRQQTIQREITTNRLFQNLNLNLETGQATSLTTRQRTRQTQITAQILKINLRTSVPSINETVFRPTSPTTSTPRFKALPFDVDEKKLLKQLLKGKQRKGIEELYLIPDFTTRILGLPPEVASSDKEAERIIKKIKTGLEIRRGLIVK